MILNKFLSQEEALSLSARIGQSHLTCSSNVKTEGQSAARRNYCCGQRVNSADKKNLKY
jgi:hypothetical protein